MEDRPQGQKAHDMIRAGREFLREQIRVSLKQIDQLRSEDTVKRKANKEPCKGEGSRILTRRKLMRANQITVR